MLDGTVESLVPLWGWILARLTGPTSSGATDPASVPWEAWPSWERYTREEERVLSFESLVLLDGLVSYLAVVIRDHAPSARWETARHRIKRYAYNNHPVLVSENTDSHIFLPAVPAGDARAVLLGMRESPDDRIAQYARAAIDDLSKEEEEAPAVMEDEPLVEVEDLGGDALRGRELQVSLREDIAHEHSRVVDRMARTLAKEDGITSVVREDRELLLVATPHWTTAQLQEWVTGYLEAKLSD